MPADIELAEPRVEQGGETGQPRNVGMNVLVWQWGRFGSGPRLATLLAEGLRSVPSVTTFISLSQGAEILQSSNPPACHLPISTYNGMAGFVFRAACAVFSLRGLVRRIRKMSPHIAICVMPGPLDMLMGIALRHLRVPFVVFVHEVDFHPGDGLPLQMLLQRILCRKASAIVALSTHVADRLLQEGLAGTPERPLLRLSHPPVGFAVPPPRPWPAHGMRLLLFGRLRQYKGLDLLAEALAIVGPRKGLEVRIIGSGPENAALTALRALPGVVVENRWVPEDEVGTLLTWADALVLPYLEASQSGVAAAALAGRRRILATNVGGLAEQLSGNQQALLCNPDALSLAAGLCQLIDEPPAPCCQPTVSPADAWREMAETLCAQIRAQVI